MLLQGTTCGWCTSSPPTTCWTRASSRCPCFPRGSWENCGTTLASASLTLPLCTSCRARDWCISLRREISACNSSILVQSIQICTVQYLLLYLLVICTVFVTIASHSSSLHPMQSSRLGHLAPEGNKCVVHFSSFHKILVHLKDVAYSYKIMITLTVTVTR